MRALPIIFILCWSATVPAQTADECRERAEVSPQVQLLEHDGNTVTVHVLDPGHPEELQVLQDASEAGDGVGRLGPCGNTALQVYVIVRRPLTGTVQQNDSPPAPAPVIPVAPPPSNSGPSTPPALSGSVDLACRGTYTECYGHPRGPLPGYTATESDGSRNVTRVPGPAGSRPPADVPARASLDAAIDNCLRPHFPDYRSPPWGRLEPAALRTGTAATLQVAFPIVQHAVNHTLEIEKRSYGKLPYGDDSYAYLEGWLGRCLWDAGVLSKGEDPRAPYKRFLASQRLSNDAFEERFYDWDQGFRSTWSPWPWYVLRDRQATSE